MAQEIKYLKKDGKYYLFDDAYLFRVHNTETMSCTEHRHDFVEMVYQLRGSCIHVIDGKEYPVRHGDLVIINYHQTHSILGNSGGIYVNVLMKPEYISRSLQSGENAFALLNLTEFEDFRQILDETHCKVSFCGEERSRIEILITMISEEMERHHPGYELVLRSCFNMLVTMIFRKMSLPLAQTFDGISDRLLAYLNKHCAEKLTLEQTAKLCAYNSSYFSRIFKAVTGMNFTAYLKKIRMQRAAELLETTQTPVKDVMGFVGYSDTTKFFKDFKAYTGFSPLQYRKSKK